MRTRTNYRQLEPEECLTITTMSLTHSGLRPRACTLGRSPSTISRELKRNATSDGTCASLPAQGLSHTPRSAARANRKLDPGQVLWGAALTILEWEWSKQQIT
jgi:IS30 family transposase